MENKNEKLVNLTKQTGRSINQTKILYDLLGGELHLLINLEEKIKNTFTYYCPDSHKEIGDVFLKEETKEIKFNIDYDEI